jgi:predicted  nucleic acid-binding Zn-ribbon protein
MSDNIDYEQFYNDVEHLVYKHKFNKRKKLLDVIDDIFDNYKNIESELDDSKNQLEDLQSEFEELKEEFSMIEKDYDDLKASHEELEVKNDEYRNILITNNLGEYLI